MIETQVNGLYTLISSNLTKEIKITNNVKYIKLSTEMWFKSFKKTDRTKLIDEKFELKNTIKLIDNVYDKL